MGTHASSWATRLEDTARLHRCLRRLNRKATRRHRVLLERLCAVEGVLARHRNLTPRSIIIRDRRWYA